MRGYVYPPSMDVHSINEIHGYLDKGVYARLCLPSIHGCT